MKIVSLKLCKYSCLFSLLSHPSIINPSRITFKYLFNRILCFTVSLVNKEKEKADEDLSVNRPAAGTRLLNGLVLMELNDYRR